jgi:hypothetical protein
MKILPTLVTYKQAKRDALDFKFQITNSSAKKTIYLDQTEPSSVLPDWIPDSELEINLKYQINLNQLREDCFLRQSDQIFLLVLVSHQNSMRTEKFLIEMTPDLSNQEIVSQLPVNKFLFGQKFFIDLSLIVDPDLTTDRNPMSATELASILWKSQVEVELERVSPLGDVRSEDLDGALWKFDFAIPNDSAIWSHLEWNSCIKIVIDNKKREIIHESMELKAIMFSELLMFLFSKIFETPDGVESILGTEKPSSFVSESRKHLLSSFGVQNQSPETIRLKWKNDNQLVFQELQRNAFRVLKSRAHNV